MRLRLIAILVSCLFLSPTWAREVWEYAKVLTPKNSLSMMSDPDGFEINDVVFDAKVCLPTDRFICLTSKFFSFVVPREKDEIKGDWLMNGLKYRVVGKLGSDLLGRQGPFHLIEQRSPGTKLTFIYSPDSGLVAFSITQKGTASMFIVSRTCGFGAPNSCREQAEIPSRQ